MHAFKFLMISLFLLSNHVKASLNYEYLFTEANRHAGRALGYCQNLLKEENGGCGFSDSFYAFRTIKMLIRLQVVTPELLECVQRIHLFSKEDIETAAFLKQTLGHPSDPKLDFLQKLFVVSPIEPLPQLSERRKKISLEDRVKWNFNYAIREADDAAKVYLRLIKEEYNSSHYEIILFAAEMLLKLSFVDKDIVLERLNDLLNDQYSSQQAKKKAELLCNKLNTETGNSQLIRFFYKIQY